MKISDTSDIYGVKVDENTDEDCERAIGATEEAQSAVGQPEHHQHRNRRQGLGQGRHRGRQGRHEVRGERGHLLISQALGINKPSKPTCSNIQISIKSTIVREKVLKL